MSGASSSALVGELARIVGPDAVLIGADARRFEHDATAARGLRGRPDAVALPATAGQVAELVAWCCAHDVAIVPRGGGTGLAGGAVPVDGGVVCGLERLDRVRRLEPELWRMEAEAGVLTATIQRLARENGLWFPPDPGAAEESQIGGNVATNAGGPHAFKYGATGAWVTGLEVAVAPGELVTVGGPLRKDVGGYDLKSLFVGSEGTLGIVTAAWLRLLPAPEAIAPVVGFYESAVAGAAAVADVLAHGLEPAALDFADVRAFALAASSYPGVAPAQAGFVVIAEAAGSEREVAAQRAGLRDVLGSSALAIDEPEGRALWRWRDGLSLAVAAARGGKLSEDVGVPVARLAEAVDRVHAIARAHGLDGCVWGHAGDGNLHAALLLDPADPEEVAAAAEAADGLFAMAVELGGVVTGEHGIGWAKRGRLAEQWTAPAVALHERIKSCLDPSNVMNPGKKVARAHE